MEIRPFPVGTEYDGSKIKEVIEFEPTDTYQPFLYRLENGRDVWIPHSPSEKESKESRNHRVTVLQLPTGFVAARLADYADMDWSTDIFSLSEERYATKEEAAVEARELAKAEGLPYIE